MLTEKEKAYMIFCVEDDSSIRGFNVIYVKFCRI